MFNPQIWNRVCIKYYEPKKLGKKASEKLYKLKKLNELNKLDELFQRT
jgi:hypothetical protein